MSVVVLLGWAAVAVPILWLVLFPFTSYRLSRHEVEILFLNWVVRRVRLNNIDAVSVGGRFPSEFWPTRGFFSGRFLAIRRKRAWFRYLVITPQDPVGMRANIYYALGWDPKASDDASEPTASGSDLSPV